MLPAWLESLESSIGAVFKVLNRGGQRGPNFKDDVDRHRFVAKLAEPRVKTGEEGHAFVLTPDYFHRVLETPQPNRVAGMNWFLGVYINRFNRRHELFGQLLITP